MFKVSEIGAKCNCNQGETVCKEHAHKRYNLSKGHYSDGYYREGGYYVAVWMTLHCELCGNRREDFIVYKWAGSQGWYPIESPFHDEKRPRRYPEIYKTILEVMVK